MKIANLILTSVNGGLEQAFVDYCCVLKEKLGHEVVAIVKDDAPYANKLLEHNIEVRKIKNNFGYHDFFAVNKISQILTEYQVDALFSHAGRSIVLGRKAIKKIKSKKIFDIAVNHSMNVKRSIGADIVISVNKQIFYSTVDKGQAVDRSFVVSNAVDLSDAVEAAPRLDLQNKNTITLGVIGRIDKTKRFCYAIKTIKELEKISGKKFVLKIAGAGPREAFLRNLAKELKIEDKVEFIGWVTDKKAFFNSIDIFLLTSEQETFGLVLLEAMKFRRPIVAVDADGPREVIRNEIDGLLVNLEPLENTETRIAPAVNRLVNEPELITKVIENSFSRLNEKFSFDAMAERLRDIVGKSS